MSETPKDHPENDPISSHSVTPDESGKANSDFENENPDDLYDEETRALDAELDSEEKIAQLETQIAELKDQLLRGIAETENIRKRSAKEVRDAKQFAIANFARDMLVATDNLSRALIVIPQEERDQAEGNFKALIDGIDMTEREMQRLLEKNGVKKLSPMGEKFDPNFHQAMFEVPNPDVPNNSVIEVVQDGYIIGERILRPAMVGVAKSGPKASTQTDASDVNDTPAPDDSDMPSIDRSV